jgi:isochorismate hydrolase
VKIEWSNSRQIWQNPLRKAVEFKRAVLSMMMMIDYILLKPRHVSAIQNHIQGVCHIKRKVYNASIYINSMA